MSTNNSPNSPNGQMLTVECVGMDEIKCWSMSKNNLSTKRATTDLGRVELPSMQRGFVWKPEQVETIWDSLVRGFPIGAFLLRETKETDSCYKYDLLDGQQRATAIKYGFYDPWKVNSLMQKCGFAKAPKRYAISTRFPFRVRRPCRTQPDKKMNENKKLSGQDSILWVDLAPPPESVKDRLFIFRIVTVAHPWGYRRNDPRQKLIAAERNKAHKAYLGCEKNMEPLEELQAFSNLVSLRKTWPHDAIVPVPVCWLWELLYKNIGNILRELEKFLAKYIRHYPHDTIKEYRNTIEKCDKKYYKEHVKKLLNGLKALKSEQFSIPTVIIQNTVLEGDIQTGNNDKQDTAHTLFLRIQTKGTPLEGDELTYSMIKARFPAIRDVIDKLDSKMAKPSRLAVLFVRLIDAQSREHKNLPPNISVGGFRSIVERKEFKKQLEIFDWKGDKFNNMLNQVKELFEGGENEYSLPPILSSQIFLHAQDMILVLLHWMLKLENTSQNHPSLQEPQRRQLLGFMTAVAWFGAKKEECAKRLWKRLATTQNQNELCGFWNHKNFMELISPLFPKSFVHVQLPLPHPKDIYDYLIDCIFKNNNYNSYMTWEKEPDYTLNNNEKMKCFYGHFWQEKEYRRDEAWVAFFWRMRQSKELLLYAQRDMLQEFFSYFDPSIPEMLVDQNTPWDYDHIHPSHYKKGTPCKLIHFWHNTIGNLRAWPASFNRSDQESSPRQKLYDQGVHNNGKTLRDYSFISPACEQDDWVKCMPEDIDDDYLSENKEAAKHLIKAIVCRTVDIYTEWYNTLCIGELMGAGVGECASQQTDSQDTVDGKAD